MSLIEQRALYMHRLQTLTNAQQKDIDEKVTAMRAKFETEQVQPYRAKLEAEKVTPEMIQLVEFIEQINMMIAYENSQSVQDETEQSKVEQIEVEQEANASVEPEEVQAETNVFHDVGNNTAGNIADAVQSDTIVQESNELIGTGFEAIVQDIADTKAKLQSASESRPGMPTIVLPRR